MWPQRAASCAPPPFPPPPPPSASGTASEQPARARGLRGERGARGALWPVAAALYKYRGGGASKCHHQQRS
eukprot:gene14632-biopygen5131